MRDRQEGRPRLPVGKVRALAVSAALLLATAGCGETGTASTQLSSPTASATATLTPTPTSAPTPVPSAVPTAPRPPAPPPTQAPPPPAQAAPPPASACKAQAPSNPWGYDFCSGSLITAPPGTFCSYFACIGNFWNGRGYVEQCQDGMFSKSGGIQGSCSYHGGNQRPLYSH